MSYFRVITFLVILTSIHVSADLVPGKCPTVTGNKFNCTKVLHSFEKLYPDDIMIDLLIYGFLPSFPYASMSFNPFAYDFRGNVSISDYCVRLRCKQMFPHFNKRYFAVECGTGIGMIDPEFVLNDQVTEGGKFDVTPRVEVIDNETCSSYLTNQFQYVSHLSPGKYFAIWGCHQITERLYDRGMWVLGSNKDENRTVVDAMNVIDAALSEMNLISENAIRYNMIINQNIFISDGWGCDTDRYYHKCQKEPRGLMKQKKVAFFIILCIILTFVAIIACIYILK